MMPLETQRDLETARPTAVGLELRPEEFWPFYAEDEVAAVADVLRSGRVNQWTGDTVGAFQAALAARFGGGHGIALMNGSVALELPLLAFGIGRGDEVIVSPRSFVASASCVRLVGATPVFADVDPDSGNITARCIEAVLTERTKAVIPVHIAGWPADMPQIMELARSRGLRVIEDCAQAHGAEIAGEPVGSFGDAAAFSFCQDKIISTGGEGGYTSFQELAEWKWAWSYKDHGKNWDKVNTPPERPGFRWLHDSLGTNWRMTALQAAIGIVQLSKLDHWLSLRERNARTLSRALDMQGLRVPRPGAGVRHANYRFYAYVDAGPDSEAMRDEIIARAGAQQLRVFSGSCSEIYLEEAFSDIRRPDLPVARQLGKTSLMLETNPTLNPDLLDARAEALSKIASEVLNGR